MSSTWSSGVGKFPKKDPDHGSWGRKIKGWFESLKCKCKCACKGRSAAWNDCTKKGED